MLSKQIKLFIIVGVSACLVCGCQVRSSTIVLKDKSKEKTKTESAVRVENGVIIYKDTQKYDTSKIPSTEEKQEDYIFEK